MIGLSSIPLSEDLAEETVQRMFVTMTIVFLGAPLQNKMLDAQSQAIEKLLNGQEVEQTGIRVCVCVCVPSTPHQEKNHLSMTRGE